MPREKSMDARKIVSMPTELIDQIANFRHSERIGSEAEAIRLLIVAGLEAKGYPPKGSS